MGQGQRARRIRTFGAGLVAVIALAGAVMTTPTVAGATVDQTTGQVQDNFWLATPSGGVYDYGVPSYGSPTGPLNQPIVGVSTTRDRKGYWLVASDGGIFSYGDAQFYGSTGNIHLNQPIVGLAATPDQKGYWLVASDGGIFSFGDAQFYGSTGSLVLNKPIVGMAPTPDGKGYWLIASDGGVFTFGDANFYGSTGSLVLNKPITGMTPTPDGKGYWLVASDGGVFTFGDASFYGSSANRPGDPVQSLVATSSGHGYWIVQQNGTALAYGDAAAQNPPDLAVLLKPVTGGDKAVLFALLQLGKPYIWGGNGPVGYDCSGLALAAWTHGDGVTFARVSDDQYHTAGTSVPLTGMAAGDLVFWGHSQTDWTTVYHTAIYVGGNRIVEATGDHVQLNVLDQWGTGDLMPNARRP